MQTDGSGSSVTAHGSEPNSTEVFSPSSANHRLPAHTSRFVFEVIGSSEELRVVEFHGQESISEPFEFQITLASRNDSLTAEQFMGRSALLTLVAPSNGAQASNELLHGEIVQFEQFSEQGDILLYRLLLVPQFWYLKRRHNHRIFQQLSVPDIIKEIFGDAGISAQYYEFRLIETCPVRNYCVQYNESEFDFLIRLMAEEGLHYHFEHRLERHIMIIADHNSAFSTMNGEANILYHPVDGMNEDQEVIQQFQCGFNTGFGKSSLRDYFFATPRDRLDAQQLSQFDQALEDYHYPGGYQALDAGIKKAQLRLQQHQTFREKARFKSNCQRLRSGCRFQLSNYPATPYNQQYLLSEIKHIGKQPQSLDEYGAGNVGHYSNEGLCIPARTLFKKKNVLNKALINSYQSSRVTGPSGEEIYTNAHAQSKVQFPWDREGLLDEHSSCWLRSAQAWAGQRWGSMILPRMGQEAKIGYIHGDPDRPVITGRLYHELNRPPHVLPRNKTRSGIKSNSTLGGKGFNEIRMEDKKAHEQLFFHAQNDLDIRVKNDRRDLVQQDRHLIVDNNRYEHIKTNSHHLIDKNQNEKIGQQLSMSIGQTLHCDIGQSVLTEVAQSAHLKAGQKIVLEAGVELTIKAGGGFIKIDASGVTAQGAKIDLNGGIGAGSANSASPQKPSVAAEADKDKPGQVFKAIPPQTSRQAQAINFKNGFDQRQPDESRITITSQAKNNIAPSNIAPSNDNEQKHWLELTHELSFVDDYGQTLPAANAAYKLRWPDGTVQKGQLDNEGFARLDDVPAGTYEVIYEPDIDDEVAATQNEIQQLLDSIIQTEQQEYDLLEKQLEEARLYGLEFPGSNALARLNSYKEAIRTGVWNGLKGLVGFAWDLLKGAGSIMYELVLRTNPITAPFKFKDDLQKLKATHAELQRFADEDLEVYAALMSDETTHDMFMQFGEDYIQAQHSLEYAETGGQVAFDIVLAILTMGAGAAASVRHVEKLKRLKPLLDKLMALFKRRRLKKKKTGNNDSEIKTSVPLHNPHRGLHNHNDLTPDFATSAESFKTIRQVDIDNLSIEDKITAEAFFKQNWSEDKVEEILSSGNKFNAKKMKKGDELYSFVTRRRNNSSLTNKAYWFDKDGLSSVKDMFFKKDHWDKEGIKGYLALPCFNKANDMIVVELGESQTVIESTIGKAVELLRYDGENGYSTGTIGKIMGGGGSQISPDARTLKLKSGN